MHVTTPNPFSANFWAAFPDNPDEDGSDLPERSNDYGEVPELCPGPSQNHMVFGIPRPDPDWTSWSDDPFRLIKRPLAAFLEPEGYTALARMSSPQTKTYERLLPATYALAQALHRAIPQRQIWGCQIAGKYTEEKSWKTITANKWVRGGREGHEFAFPEKPLALLNVLKMLASGTALGTTDPISYASAVVSHVRIDVDLDTTFCHGDLADLSGEIGLVDCVFAAFSLKVHVFRTGNRGIQAVTPIPPLPVRVGRVLIGLLRAVLRGSRHHAVRATDFKTSTEGILRLPLGLHGTSGSLGLFLGRDGRHLPPAEQIVAATASFCTLPEWDTSWMGEIERWLARHLPGRTGLTDTVLARIVSDHPNNSLVKMFSHACDEFDVKLGKDWIGLGAPHSPVCPVNPATELVSHTTVPFRKSVGHSSKEVVSHTTVPFIKHLGHSPVASGLGVSAQKLKQIGWKVLHEGFHPGQSYAYYMNTLVAGTQGKNAVGWALVVFDGNQEAAQDHLIRQAQETPESGPGSTEDRVGLIQRLIPQNNTYARFQHCQAMRPCRSLDAEVYPQDTHAAQRVLDALPGIRAEKNGLPTGKEMRVKVFQPKALLVIGHILELMLAAARSSEDGMLALSGRTLANEINHRWPDCRTSQKDVSRQLLWITKGCSECLVEALVVKKKAAKATEATVYSLGPGLNWL